MSFIAGMRGIKGRAMVEGNGIEPFAKQDSRVQQRDQPPPDQPWLPFLGARLMVGVAHAVAT